MKRLFLCVLFAVLSAPLPAFAQQEPFTDTVLVLPFENRTRKPSLEWISESFPEVFADSFAHASGVFPISRDDRRYAFDRLGIPASLHASRATLYRIAEQLDADYVVMGDFSSDGQTVTANAQVLDMRALHLSQPITQTGPLTSLLQVETALAYDVAVAIHPQNPPPRTTFSTGAGVLRLDAFENYIRGIVAVAREEKLQRFRDAVRLDPQYTAALLHLGRANYEAHQYQAAVDWLGRVPAADASAGEARFLMAISEYMLGQFEKAEADFQTVLDRVPLPEVENDLGAAAIRRGSREALVHFERAMQADTHDPDYRFNLALAQAHFGDSAAATRNLHEILNRHLNDGEARQLLDSLSSAGSVASAHMPLPRLKLNYDESSYREIQLEMQNAADRALAKASPAERAAYHAQRGHDLLLRGLLAPAEDEFREAVSNDPGAAEAHAGLARIAELRNQPAAARTEAETSMRIHANADALLVLARLDLAENHLDDAERELRQAAALDSANPAIADVQHELDSRRAASPH